MKYFQIFIILIFLFTFTVSEQLMEKLTEDQQKTHKAKREECQADQELMNIEYKEASIFRPDINCGKVIKVYDGDTITIATRLSGAGPIYRFSVRFLGIDTPEKRTKNLEEKKIALIAQKVLSDKIMGKVVTFPKIDYDKYGRILAHVYYLDENLSQFMIDNRLAVEYDGGTKMKPDWAEYYEHGTLPEKNN
jgi:endonuclease YncB( thermonuclease family)